MDEKFWFPVGYFCPALSKAVKTMKKGEKATLTVKPQCKAIELSKSWFKRFAIVVFDLVKWLETVTDAFGEKGRPADGDEGAVPPNATLQISLELVSWNTVSDVTSDKKVLKKILKEGEGYERPNDGAVVQGKWKVHQYFNNISLTGGWVSVF